MPSVVQRARGRVARQRELARLSPVARSVREQRLTYLTPTKLRNLERCADRVHREGVPGATLETGVALGGSAVVLARRLPDRDFHGYDVFGMIPPPGERDGQDVNERYEHIRAGASTGIDGDPYYGYRDDLLDEVLRTLRLYEVDVDGRVHLHRGLFEDTLLPEWPVALAHIDCDWYDPVLLSLERIYPRLSPGGFVVVDDYYAYSGARQAVDEFLAAHDDIRPVLRTEHLVLRRG